MASGGSGLSGSPLRIQAIGQIQMSKNEYVRTLLAHPDVPDGIYTTSGSGASLRLVAGTIAHCKTHTHYSVITHERTHMLGLPFARKTILKHLVSGSVKVLQVGL